MSTQHPLVWLEPGDPFPDIANSWPADSDAAGLLAAGGSLDLASLLRAYSHGIFPWYSPGQPILWWSTDPRMVLQVSRFKMHRSLRKTIQNFRLSERCEIRFDSSFSDVINNCANTKRKRQGGTWIVPEMIDAYCNLHMAGHAHSVETWMDGELVGGLYCVNIGRAIFGESMFAHRTDASKLALAALICFCRAHGVEYIDCQQNTPHLRSLGACEMPRNQFASQLKVSIALESPVWHFDTLYWQHLFDN